MFTALLMTCMIIFVCTLAEAARVTSAKAGIQDISKMSADSGFAHYAKELFEDYGLFGLWKNRQQIQEEYTKYAVKTDRNSIDLLGISLLNCNASNIEYLTDNNGEYVARQIDSIMQYKITEDILKKIINELHGLTGTGKIRQMLDTIEGVSDIVQSIEESVQAVSGNISGITDMANEIQDCINDMNAGLKEIMSFKGKKEKLLSLKAVYEENFDWLRKYTNQVSQNIEKVMIYTEQFESFSEQAKPEVDKINEMLNDSEEQLGEELIKSLKEQIEELGQQIGDKTADYYNIYSCIDVLSEVKEQIAEYQGKLDEIDQAINRDEFDKIGEIIFKIPDVDKLKINYEVKETEGSRKSIVKTMLDIFNKGMLALVVDDIGKISKEKIVTDNFPSKTIDYNAKSKYTGFESSEEYIRKILCSQYILDYFGNYTDQSDGKMKYEVEYIITGNSSEKKNLSNVVTRLVALREGFNLAYLVTDKEKCIEAETMAAAIVGFTGVTPLITVTKFLILGVWATAESVVDVRMLLEGEEIGLIKNASTWNTSLSNLASFQKEDYDNKLTGMGMNYESYLRILLISQNSVRQIYRIMDVIEYNLQDKYNENFSISRCINTVKFNAEYAIKQLFAVPGSKKKYKYKIETQYSY